MAINTSRIDHEIGDIPNWFRSVRLEQIINDISDESFGQGYVEVSRNVNKMIETANVWRTSSKIKKMFDITINRIGSTPFVSSIVCEVYDNDGTNIIATITQTVVRDVNNMITSVDTQTTRP